jgi:hypothetical protein
MGGGSYKSYLMDQLSRMHVDIENTTRKLELEQRRLYNLDKLINNTEKELEKKRDRSKTSQINAEDGDEHKSEVSRGSVKCEQRKTKTITSPNDSLQQHTVSTREPSTYGGDRGSLDASSLARSRQFPISNPQMGGGSYKSYLMDQLSRMHVDIENTTRKLELEQRRLYNLDKLINNTEKELEKKRDRSKTSQINAEDGDEHKSEVSRGSVKCEQRKTKTSQAHLDAGPDPSEAKKRQQEKQKEDIQEAFMNGPIEYKAHLVNSLERNLVRAIEDLNQGNC